MKEEIERTTGSPDTCSCSAPTSLLLKEIRKLANSPAEVVMKYIMIGVITLFGVFMWFAWQSNAAQPERLYALLERSVVQNSESLKVQEQSLAALREFSVRVPMEHADHGLKLVLLQVEVDRMSKDHSLLREAVIANTEAVGRLITALEKNTLATPP